MCRAQAEPHPRRYQRRRRIPDNDDDDRDFPLLHHPREHRQLPGIEREERDDGRIVVTENNKPELFESTREIAGVERQTLQPHSPFRPVSQFAG